ncbi:unnamed protein product [Nesidiocoris tenuis]|uniref:Uncharacterized protein n=1 Tax=Nesidiocoris tenuis TaxID=355587 RepID=A0A6H5HSQ0_9HEMI|nr:unnamed protein product [Nesidiocoris tenuis]
MMRRRRMGRMMRRRRRIMRRKRRRRNMRIKGVLQQVWRGWISLTVQNRSLAGGIFLRLTPCMRAFSIDARVGSNFTENSTFDALLSCSL